MREVKKIGRNMSTPDARAFWESVEETVKEIKEKWPNWKKPKEPPAVPVIDIMDMRVYVDVKEEILKNKIRSLQSKVDTAYSRYQKIASRKSALIKKLQKSCQHRLCIQRTSHYRDEYDDWHDGPLQRKCIECCLSEDEKRQDNNWDFDKLKNSQVVKAIKKIDGKTFEIEMKDLVL